MDVLDGMSALMEESVPDLTTALSKEAGPEDNRVEYPYGEIILVSNVRNDPWNTDLVGYTTDSQGDRSGYILDAKFDLEAQLSLWIAVPSDNWNVQALGQQLQRNLRQYDENHPYPEPLPDGSGGTLTDVEPIRIINGGELPVRTNQDPPARGYQLTVSVRFTDRVSTDEDTIKTVDIPHSGDLTDTDETDLIEIEYQAQ